VASERGRQHVQLLRCPAEMQLLCRRDKASQLVQLHGWVSACRSIISHFCINQSTLSLPCALAYAFGPRADCAENNHKNDPKGGHRWRTIFRRAPCVAWRCALCPLSCCSISSHSSTA
jgi:hypothetical protein